MIAKKTFLLVVIVAGFISVLVLTLPARKEESEDLTVIYFKSYLSMCDSSGMSEDNTYTSKKHGFAFKYPEDVVVCELDFGKPNEGYGMIAQFHIMNKRLFLSTDPSYINTHYTNDSFTLKIRQNIVPDIMKGEIMKDLPVRKVGGVSARSGVGKLPECKDSFCSEIIITRFLHNNIEYEFIGNKSFDTILNTFTFLPNK